MEQHTVIDYPGPQTTRHWRESYKHDLIELVLGSPEIIFPNVLEKKPSLGNTKRTVLHHTAGE